MLNAPKASKEVLNHRHSSAEYHFDNALQGMIIQLPGQNVPMHLDAPYFMGTDRFGFPIWLLVVMHRSGLFKAETVDQVRPGFFFWDNSSATTIS